MSGPLQPETLPDFTFQETADLLRVSVRTVRRLRASGRIGCYRHGRSITFGHEHIEAYRKSVEVQPRIKNVRRLA